MQELCPRAFVSLFCVAMMKYLRQVNPRVMFILCTGLEGQGHGAGAAQLWGELSGHI